MHAGYADQLHRRSVPIVVLGDDRDRRGLVRAVDRELLGDVVRVGARESGRTDEDHRLRRQVDVLLVLGTVTRDGLVAELRGLDPHLVCSDAIRAVADHSPVPPGRRLRVSGATDLLTLVEHGPHRVGQLAERLEEAVVARWNPERIGERPRQHESRGHLGVERLRRGDAHLHIAAVGRVQHPVGAIDEVAVPPVHDGDDRGAPSASQVHRRVGVGRGAALRDRDDERPAHVAGEPEAGQLGRQHRLHAQRVGRSDRVRQRRGQALAGNGRRPLPDDDDPVDAAGTQPLAHQVRKHLGADLDAEPTVAFHELGAQRLAEGPRRLGDLLEQVVRVVTPVDVARRDLRVREIGLGGRERCAVVGEPQYRAELARVARVEYHDLAATPRVVRLGRRLAVETQVGLCLLDESVRFAGDDVGVLGEPDVETLAAPAQREEDLARRGGRVRTDRDRPLERSHGLAERIRWGQSTVDRASHQRRDDLRVGRDLRCDPQVVKSDQLGVVVDVAVERGGGIRRPEPIDLLVIERMGVCLRDDADACPPRVRQDDDLRAIARERLPEQLVADDGRAQHRDVVAELADLGRRLVHEADHVVIEPHRSRSMQRVGPLRAAFPNRRIVEIERVMANDHFDAGGVTPAHLEAVHRRERDLDGEVPVECRRRGRVAGQRTHGVGGPEPIAAQGPEAVLQLAQRRVECLVGHGRGGDPGIETRLEDRELGIQLVQDVDDPDATGRVPQQGPDTGSPAQRGVDRAEVRRGAEEPVGTGRVVGPGRRGGLELGARDVESVTEPGEVRRGPIGGTAEHRHDAAHEARQPTGPDPRPPHPRIVSTTRGPRVDSDTTWGQPGDRAGHRARR